MHRIPMDDGEKVYCLGQQDPGSHFSFWTYLLDDHGNDVQCQRNKELIHKLWKVWKNCHQASQIQIHKQSDIFWGCFSFATSTPRVPQGFKVKREQEGTIPTDSFIAFQILPGWNFCGWEGISSREGRESLWLNLFTWPKSRGDRGYVRSRFSFVVRVRSVVVVSRKLELRWDSAGHLLTTQSLGWPPEGHAVSEVLPRQEGEWSLLLSHIVFIFSKFSMGLPG